MYLDRATTIALGAALLLLGACQAPDVGGRCNMGKGAPAGTVATDYFASGVTECDNLICLKSAFPPGSTAKPTQYCSDTSACDGYCSKPCVSNDDCSQGDTGLVCRPVVLDDTFLNSLPEDVRAKYRLESQRSNYCAIPLQ